MGTRKYRLTEETITITRNGMEVTLHRIEALRDFADVKAGDLGGFVESEANLSHDGDCWVYDTAKVYGDAEVYGDANVHGNANVYDNAWIYGNAEVYGCAKVSDNAEVFGNAKVHGNAEVHEMNKICGDTMLGGNK